MYSKKRTFHYVWSCAKNGQEKSTTKRGILGTFHMKRMAHLEAFGQIELKRKFYYRISILSQQLSHSYGLLISLNWILLIFLRAFEMQLKCLLLV